MPKKSEICEKKSKFPMRDSVLRAGEFIKKKTRFIFLMSSLFSDQTALVKLLLDQK